MLSEKRESGGPILGTILALSIIIPIASLNLLFSASKSQKQSESPTPTKPLKVSFIQNLAPEAQDHMNHWVNVNFPNNTIIPADPQYADFVVLQAPLPEVAILEAFGKPIILLPESHTSPFRD